MNRWNELFYGLGFNILMPRLFLFVVLPLAFASGWFWTGLPDAPTVPWLLRSGLGVAIVSGCLLLFGLSVGANLCISRYLRIHQTAYSPYTYDATTYVIAETGYFRIQISDVSEFRQLMRAIRRDHRGEAIWFWQCVEVLVWVPPVLLVFLIVLPFLLLDIFARAAWARLHRRKMHHA